MTKLEQKDNKAIENLLIKLRNILYKSSSWEKVYNYSEPCCPTYFCCAFFRLAEEIKGASINSSKELDEITGITLYIENEKGVDKTKGEIYLIAKEHFYTWKLENMLREGAKYKDLLEETPQKNGLPEIWGSYYRKEMNQKSVIAYAIHAAFWLEEFLRPALRDVAIEIEAPYSIILKAFNYFKD